MHDTFRKAKHSLLLAVSFALLVLIALPEHVLAVSILPESLKAEILKHAYQDVRKLPAMHGEEEVAIEIRHFPTGPFVFPETNQISDIHITIETGISATAYSDTPLIRVALASPSGRIQNFGVPIKITVIKPVWMVKNMVLPGQTLSAADFVLVKQDISRKLPYIIGQESPLSNYAARINLRPGELLDARQIVHPPAVRQFTDVNILLSQKTAGGDLMNIRFVGTALQDGGIGQIIRVKKQFDRPKYYNAKVIDRNTVQVEL